MTADKTRIRCWGHQLASVKAGHHAWAWNFLRADMAFPILGSDFLGNFKLLVDITGRRLLLPGGLEGPSRWPDGLMRRGGSPITFILYIFIWTLYTYTSHSGGTRVGASCGPAGPG